MNHSCPHKSQILICDETFVNFEFYDLGFVEEEIEFMSCVFFLLSRFF